MKGGPKLAPERTTLPALRSKTPSGRVQEFFRRFLRHVKGEMAGRPLVLSRWMVKDIIEPIFNPQRPDRSRQIRTAYVEVPRKNSKSTTAAGLGLYLLYADDEPGPEIVCAASDRGQAEIVFNIAREMVEADPYLKAMTQVYRRELVIPASAARPWESRYKVISSEAYSKHGMNLHGAIIDELHAHQDGGELYDVLTKSMGSRRQPLTFVITTAGYDRSESSICWTLHQHALRVRDGLALDPSFHGVVYAAPLEADWTDPKVWAQANPGLGTSLRLAYLEAECNRAQQLVAYQNEFRRYHLDQWTEAATAWIPLTTWDAGRAPLDLEALRGRPCYAGLDMSTNTDLSAFVLVFPHEDGSYDVLPYAWCPAVGIRRRSQNDRAPYDRWVQGGFLEATEGDAVDQETIRARILELAARYDIRAIGYDDWNMGYLGPKLFAEGLNLVPIRQTFKALSGATKLLERLALKRALRHGGHPVLRWCLANTFVETDGPENIKPSKKKSTERIDLVVALIMALSRLEDNPTSVYETRGALAL